MSHHDDNLYTILGKLQTLRADEQSSVAETKTTDTVYESVEAQGSVLEGVNKVEAKLLKQFQESKKAKKDYDKDGKIESEKDEVIGSRRKAAGLDEDSKKAKKDYDKDGEIESEKDEVIGSRRKAAGLDENQVDEMFAFDTKPGKDKGRPDELARRAKLGKNPLAKGSPHASEYKTKDKYGNAYNIAGPKGQLPEEREENVAIPGTDKKAQSKYTPVNKPAPVKKFDKPTDKFDKIKNEETVSERARNKYSIGMAAAKKSAGYGSKPAHNLPKKVINKGHEIARSINEGINFAEMMRDTDTSVAEMLSELQADITDFKKTGHASDKLEAFLKVHHHGKRLMGEAVPKGPSFAPQDAMALAKPTAPFEPSRIQGTKPPSMVDRAKGALGSVASGINKVIGHGSDEDLLADLRNKSTMEEDAKLHELARLAGLTLEENFELNDVPGMGQEGKISVSSNSSSDGNRSVSINADGEAADELMQMLKIAGLGGGDVDLDMSAMPDDELEMVDVPTDCGDDVVSMDTDGLSGDEGVEEDYSNEPDEQYFSMKASTLNPGEGDNGEKQMNPDRPTFKNGDNAMSRPPMREAVLALEAELAAEYESIKKVSK